MDNNTSNISKSLTNNSGLRPSLLGGFPQQALLVSENTPEMYINSMSPKDHLAYTIAKEHLGTSFTVEKSVGYLRWLKKRSVDDNTPS